MKINQVKNFVASNISRFEKNGNKPKRVFNLYDKNNNYRGEYKFVPICSNDYYGIKTSMSVTRIISDNLKQEMQEIVCMNKDYITLYDPRPENLLKTKALPSEITTTTTILDFVNDRFKTIRIVSKLINRLQKIGKDNPDFICSKNFVIYEPLKEKPKYEKSVEYIKEGSISEINQNPLIHKNKYSTKGSITQIPYRFW